MSHPELKNDFLRNDGGVAVRERAPSPHVVSLEGKLESHRQPAKSAKRDKPRMPARTFVGRWKDLLDERIHLHDLRMRTLSIRPRGWKDFPPAGATTIAQAVRIMSSRFFNQHPLAELTVLSWLHMIVVAVSHLAQAPGRVTLAAMTRLPAETETGEGDAPAALPLPVADEAPAAAPAPLVNFAPAAARKLPLRARILTALSPTSRKLRPKQQKLPKAAAAPRTGLSLAAFRRPAVGFAALALAVVTPITAYGSLDGMSAFKERVAETGKNAVAQMLVAGEAAKARDFGAATRAFAEADAGLADAKRQLGILTKMLDAAPKLLPGTAIGSAGPLLNAAHEVAQGGERLAAGMSAADVESDPTAKIAALSGYLNDALPHLERASRQLELVSADAVPADYRAQVAEAKRAVPQLTAAVRKATAVTAVMDDLLGTVEPKRYLVIFQNNAELRPTGGFMGSFALLDVSKGKVVNMEIPGGGTYDLKGSLTQRVRSPQPLHLINPLWQFQDANWYPDFPTSAKQITWFYDKSGGPTTDGVVAINASLMEQLLAVTGPIEMPEYGKTITAENFYEETQHQVEVGYDKAENKPKQFIADLAPKVLERLMSGSTDQAVALAALMDGALARRDVQLWMRDAETQDALAGLGWTGQIKSTDGDYLQVVHTNIAGQKSDRRMRDEIAHDVKVLPDGTGIVTLTLTRTHEGQKGEQFAGVRNVDYVRFYVPQGSMLVQASGFTQPDPKLFKLAADGTEADPAVDAAEQSAKIDRDSGTRIGDEGDKTVFGNWLMTDPGQTSTVTLVYQLPAGAIRVTRAPEGRLAELYGKLVGNRRDRIDYALLVQKQSGAAETAFTSSIDLPRGFGPSWQNEERVRDERGRWTLTRTIDRDAFFATVAEGN